MLYSTVTLNRDRLTRKFDGIVLVLNCINAQRWVMPMSSCQQSWHMHSPKHNFTPVILCQRKHKAIIRSNCWPFPSVPSQTSCRMRGDLHEMTAAVYLPHNSLGELIALLQTPQLDFSSSTSERREGKRGGKEKKTKKETE